MPRDQSGGCSSSAEASSSHGTRQDDFKTNYHIVRSRGLEFRSQHPCDNRHKEDSCHPGSEEVWRQECCWALLASSRAQTVKDPGSGKDSASMKMGWGECQKGTPDAFFWPLCIHTGKQVHLHTHMYKLIHRHTCVSVALNCGNF